MRCLFLILLFGSSFSYSQAVDAGNAHAIILDDNGHVFCVGRNDHGQLGNGDYEPKNIPVDVGLTHINSIARG